MKRSLTIQPQRSLIKHPLIIVFAFLTLCLLVTSVPATAGERDKTYILEGQIENWPVDSIKLDGEYHSIKGVPLLNYENEPVSKDELRKGRFVGIVFKNEAVFLILVDDKDLPR